MSDSSEVVAVADAVESKPENGDSVAEEEAQPEKVNGSSSTSTPTSSAKKRKISGNLSSVPNGDEHKANGDEEPVAQVTR